MSISMQKPSWIPVVVVILLAGACGKRDGDKKARKPKADPSQEATALTPCERQCTRPNLCVRASEKKPGICVRPCRRHKDCMEGFRCTGGSVKSYMVGVKTAPTKGYCQKASLKEGETCRARIGHYCLKGYACFDGKCRKSCKRASDCGPKRRCIALTKASALSHLRWVKQEVHSRRCLPAEQTVGAACDYRRFQFCEPGLQCHDHRCYKTCGPERSCDAGTRCVPIRIRAGVLGRQVKTLYQLCQKASKPAGAACSVGKLPLCGPGLRCVKQKCTSVCRAHKDCPDGQACNRGWFSGTGWEIRRSNDWKPDFFLCGKGKRNIIARAYYSTCRKTSDCLQQHTCVKGRCRPWCKADADCPRFGRRRPSCQVVPSTQGGSQKACY